VGRRTDCILDHAAAVLALSTPPCSYPFLLLPDLLQCKQVTAIFGSSLEVMISVFAETPAQVGRAGCSASPTCSPAGWQHAGQVHGGLLCNACCTGIKGA
jgi:hypothetical protein